LSDEGQEGHEKARYRPPTPVNFTTVNVKSKDEEAKRAKILCNYFVDDLVQSRPGPGKQIFRYLSVNDVVSTANSVWGPEGWSQEIKNKQLGEVSVVKNPHERHLYQVIATSQVRVTIRATGKVLQHSSQRARTFLRPTRRATAMHSSVPCPFLENFLVSTCKTKTKGK